MLSFVSIGFGVKLLRLKECLQVYNICRIETILKNTRNNFMD